MPQLNENDFPALQPAVKLKVWDEQIIITAPNNEVDRIFITSLGSAHWDSVAYEWVLPFEAAHLAALKEYFGQRLTQIQFSEQLEIRMGNRTYLIRPQDLLISKYQNQLLFLFFYPNYHLEHWLRQFPRCKYNARYHYWSLPFSPVVVSKIEQVALETGLICSLLEE